MKYAVVAVSGSQYKVEENQTITVDHLDSKEGDKGSLDQILLLVDDKKVEVGKPTVKDSSIEYEVVKNYQGEKIRVFKYKSKSRYQKTQGFRAQLTDIKITKIK
jgi:large subunit ribosomal protein L21